MCKAFWVLSLAGPVLTCGFFLTETQSVGPQISPTRSSSLSGRRVLAFGGWGQCGSWSLGSNFFEVVILLTGLATMTPVVVGLGKGRWWAVDGRVPDEDGESKGCYWRHLSSGGTWNCWQSTELGTVVERWTGLYITKSLIFGNPIVTLNLFGKVVCLFSGTWRSLVCQIPVKQRFCRQLNLMQLENKQWLLIQD